MVPSSNIIPFPQDATRASSFSKRVMTGSHLDGARHVVKNEQILINMVSQRVRQLNEGHRPLVQIEPRMSLADIALKEIAEQKLAFEFVGDDVAKD